MVIIKIKENPESVMKIPIRKHFDETNQKWYFSIVDVIAGLTDSTDARNYWKVLKNRLKKKDSELVTHCNLLKMKAKDGKYYLTDTADSETLIHIIESIPKATVEAFKVLIADIQEIKENPPLLMEEGQRGGDVEKLPPRSDPGRSTPPNPRGEDIKQEEELNEPETEAQLLVDAYQTSTTIFIKTFVAGVNPNLLNIHVGIKKIIIQGQRSPEQIQDNYLNKELYWPTFSRTISLPSPVDRDSLKISEESGMLTIELKKISN